jgi:acyl-CoA thioesterase I
MPLREKWIIIGDSITDARRTDGILPWGKGYANLFFQWLQTQYRHKQYDCYNQGICGNTIRGLHYRWQQDVLDLKPDYLIIYIGVNDAHQALESTENLENKVNFFQNTYLEILQKVREILSPEIVLVTPFYCHPDQSLPIYQAVTSFAEAVRTLAVNSNSQLLDLHQIFTEIAQTESNFRKWSADSVHPTDLGHRLISDKLQAIVYKFLVQ